MWSAGSKAQRGTGAAGFTLLELLAVLVIAGLLLAVAPPMFSSLLPGLKIKSAAQQLVSALHQTRRLAISRGSPQRLELDAEERTVHGAGSGNTFALPDFAVIEATVAESQQRSASRAGIAFFPDGSSTGGRISLAHAGRTYQVNVDWLTGRVSLRD
jgi:general secretion pathway protein H